MGSAEALAIVAGVLVLLLLVAGGAAAFIFKGSGAVQAPAQPQQAAPRGVRGAGRLAAGARRRRQQAGREDGAEDDGDEAVVQQGGRQEQTEAKYSRRDAYEERRRQRDEEREAAEAAAEAEAVRRDEARRAAEEAEAAKWLGEISTETEGTAASAAEEEQDLLQAFVDYIIERKTVVLEELAADFNLRVQDVIARVRALDGMGRISGIMDDRGKFIHISRAEMEAVADFVRARGRVAISELAAKSNQFIDLEARAAGGPDVAAASDLDLDLEPSQ